MTLFTLSLTCEPWHPSIEVLVVHIEMIGQHYTVNWVRVITYAAAEDMLCLVQEGGLLLPFLLVTSVVTIP